MNKRVNYINGMVVFFFVTLIFCGCATQGLFISSRNDDMGRNVNLSYATPALTEIIPYNQTHDKYIFDFKDGCKFAYYVNKENKTAESWEYLCSPKKCKTGFNWRDWM